MCDGKLKKLLNCACWYWYLLVMSNLIRAVYYLTITKEEHIGKKNNNQGGKVEIVYELNYGILV